MKKLIPSPSNKLCLVMYLIIAMGFVSKMPQGPNRVTLFVDNSEVVFKEGISMAQIAKSNGKMNYVVRQDLRQLIPKSKTGMRISLVRDQRAIYQIYNDRIAPTETLEMGRIFTSARPDDAVVIELIGLPKGLPQILTFPFTK